MPDLLIREPTEKKTSGGSPHASAPRPKPAAWRAVGWFGLLFVIVGLGDVALAWYPLDLGNPEWEFGTVAMSFSALPVVSMGFAALFASALALGGRWRVRTVSALLLAMGLAVLFAFVLFLTDVPLALEASPERVSLGIKRAIAKTSLLGFAFSIAYFAAGIAGFRHAHSSSREA